MKKHHFVYLLSAALTVGSFLQAHDTAPGQSTLKVGIVNFKNVVDDSKIGKQEQANFELLKKQMEAVLEEKEKALNEMSAKFNDPDYLDSLSSEAENELKHKFRMLNQEIGQIQGQYYQTLNQANVKILQRIKDLSSKAASKVGKQENLDIILDDDVAFYYAQSLDITKGVVVELDRLYEAELQSEKGGAARS